MRFADRFAALLGEVDLVTFDVFDTALVRGLLRPPDLFLQWTIAGLSLGLLSPALCARVDVAKARADAERDARLAAWENESRGEIRIDEIYAQLGDRLDLDSESLVRLMQLETELELAQSARNPFVGALYEAARRAGKRIGFLSDMYLGEAVIRQMLEQGGYAGYSFAHVSSTSFDTKARGSLYRTILRTEGLAPQRWLHVGDNFDSDVRAALEAGIRALYYEKCTARLQIDRAAYRRHLADPPPRTAEIEARLFHSSCAGLVSSRTYCNPDGGSTDSVDGFWADWGYRHVGPLLAGFGTWLARELQRRDAHRVYFLARDGYLIKSAVDRILASEPSAEENVTTQYLYASRRAYNFASITRIDDESLDFLTSGTSRLTPRAFLARIDIDIDRHPVALRQSGLSADQPVHDAHGYRCLRELLRLLEEPIIDHAQAEFALLSRYFREQGLLDQSEIILVDLGWHGSLQQAIGKLISRMGSNADTAGLYLGTFAPARRHTERGMAMKGYLCENGLPVSMDQSIKRSVEIIEWIFSAPHGSVRRFAATQDGVQPVLAAFEFEQMRWERALAVQRGALEFVDDYVRKWGGRALPDVPPHDAIRALDRALARPSLEEAIALGDMKHAEGFGHVAVERYIARPTGSLRNPLSYPSLLQGYRDAFWRAGYARRLLSPTRGK